MTDIAEILASLEADPTATEALEHGLQEALAGGPEALDPFLADLTGRVTPGPVAEAVLGVLDRAFRKARDSEAGPSLGFHAGTLAWKTLGDLVRAEFYMRALDAGSPHFETWREFYRQFYASRGNWLRLEQFMNETGQRAGLQQAETLRALARTAREFQNHSKELSYWQALASEAPDDAEADAELERLYTELGRWPSLANLLKARLDRAPEGDTAARVAILQQMLAVFRDQMKAEPKVLATYQQILDVDPGNREAMDALLERYEAAGRWPDYAKVLARKIEHTQDRAERIRLREVQAHLMETRFSNALEAIKAYEELLELEPDRPDILEKLKDLYDKRRDFENLIRIRRMEVDRESDPARRVALLADLAVLATDRLRKVPVAIALWEQVLGTDPDHAEALRNLEALYEREKDVPRLCEVLERRVALAADPADQVLLLEKLAQVFGARMGEPEKATATWRKILDVKPDHDRARRELRARYLAEHRWDDLEWFLRTFGSVDELARTLEAQVGSITDPSEKEAILFKLAALWRDELAQPARAVKDLEAVLAQDPQNLKAATDLIALYHHLSDYKRLPPVYEVAIAGTGDRGRRLALMIEAAQVHERHLRNLERAFFWYVAAFKEDMLNPDLREELERLAGPSKNWDTYVAVLEQAAAVMDDRDLQVTTWLRVGEIYATELREDSQALRAFNQVLELDALNRQAITALEDLYRKVPDYEALVGILRRRLELERRSEQRRAVRFEIAGVLVRHLHRVDEAVATYESILEADPEDAQAYEELGEVFLAERRFEDLLGLLRRQVEVFSGLPGTPPDVLADLYCRIGVLTCGTAGPGMSAVVAWSKALQVAPHHAETLAWLEEMLGDEDLRLAIVQLLKGPYEALGRFADLADLLEIELMERGDGDETLPLLWTLEDLYQARAPDPRKRFRTLGRILAITPADRKAWDAAESAAGLVEAWRELAQRFEVAADAVEDPVTRVDLKLRIARIEWDRVRNVDQARRCYHDVLALDDRNQEALEALETIYEGTGDHPELLKVYRRRYEVSEFTGEKMAYAFKMAAELADHLDDVEGAIQAVRLVLDMDPEYAPAYRELDNYYTRAERWDDLARTLQERTRLADSAEERAYLRVRLAEVLEGKLGDLEGAVLVYRAILADDPEHETAFRELERLFPRPEVRVRIAPILLPIYERRGDHARLVEVYEVLAGAEEDIENRIRYYETIAALYEDSLGDLDQAFEVRARAFATAPGRADLVEAVLRAGRARGAVVEAILVLCEHAFEIADEERRKETHRVIATEARTAGERDLAKRHFNEVLLMDPGDLASIAALIEMHREDDEVDPLQALVRRKAELVLAADEKAELLAWAADLLAGRLGRHDEAIALYGQVLDLDPANLRAIEALEDLYRRLERFEDLVETLQRKADFAPDPETRVAAPSAKGQVLHERLGNTPEAVETYLQVLEIAPERLDTLRTLDRLYGIQEDWWNQYQVLERIFPLAEADEKLAVHVRMGRLLEQRLGDPTRAVHTYSEVLASCPGHAEALDALEGMVRSGEAASEAFSVLGPALADAGQWERLYVVREVLAEHEEDVPRKVAHLMEMGRIAAENLEQPIRAFECYRQAFLADPLRPEALERAERLAGEHDLWADVPPMIREAVSNIEGMPEALDLSLRAAAILRDRLGDREAAAAAYEAILANHPDDPTALQALDDLYSDMERFEDLARVLRARAEAARDPGDKVPFLLRHAEVAEGRLGLPGQAFEARREVLYLSPGHPEAVRGLRATFDAGRLRTEILETLEPIYRETGEWEALASMFEAALPEVSDPAERKTLLLKLADVCQDHLGRLEASLQWRGRALIQDSEDDALATQVEQFAGEIGAWGVLHEVWLDAAAASAGDDRRVALWHKAAECARDRIGDVKKAETVYRWILGVAPSDRQALAALDALYASQERWASLLDVLEQECQAAEFDDERVGFFLRMGTLNRDRLDNPDGAVKAFRAALKLDETNREALTALVDLLEARSEWRDLFGVLDTLSSLAPSASERAGLLRRMASIAERDLGEVETALGLWDEVSRIEPEDVAALRELERIQRSREDWSAFVEVCEREIPLAGGDAGRVVTLLRDVAVVSEERLSDPYQAQHAWRRLLQVAPDHIEALQALRRLYRESGDLEALSEVLHRLATTGDLAGPDLEALLVEHARLLTEEMPRPDGAIDRWKRVLDLVPGHVEALTSLERLYEDTRAYAECVDIVKKRASLEADAAARAEILMKAADLEADRIGDFRAAARTLEEVLASWEVSPDSPPPAPVVRLLNETFERLQGLYARIEDWEREADLLLRRDAVLALPEAAGGQPEERVQNFLELARCYEERLGNLAAAFYTVVKAAQVAPGDDQVLSEAWRLAQALGNYEEYVAAMDTVVDRMSPGARLEHLVRFGDCLRREADRAAEAVPYYERVLREWPENEEALAALTDLYAALSRPEDLVRTLEIRVGLTPDYLEKVQLQMRAARVLEQDLGDVERALVAYRAVLELDEGQVEALRALARLHEGRREWDDLIRVLEVLAPLEPGEEVRTRLRIAEVLEREVGDADRAIAAYEAVLSLEPTEATALERLQTLYGAQNNWKGLAQVFERLLDYSSETPDRVLFCERLGLLYEQALGDKATALGYYQRILDMTPEDDEVLETCLRLMGDLEDWNGVINLLESRVARAGEAGAKVAFLARVARVYEDRQGDINSAISTWQRVLEADGGMTEAYSELARLFSAIESWEDVVQTLLRWKEHADEREFADLMLKAATIVKERLENPERALKLLGDVLRVDPLNEEAAEKMRLIYAEFEDWEKVAEVYLTQEAHATSDEARARLRAAAGEVFLTRLKDQNRAVQHFERALELNPRMQDVALSLARAYVASRKWEKAMPLLDLQLAETDVAADPGRAAEIHFQLGLCAENLFDHDKAFREYQTASKQRPDHPGILMGLGRLYQRKQLWQLAKDHFLKVLEVVADRPDVALDADDLVNVHFALGEVSLELGDLPGAMSYLERVREDRPQDDRALTMLIAVAERSEDWSAVVRYRQALAESRADPFERFAIWLEIGDIYREKMGNTYGAAAAYKEALEINPDARVALLRLFNLYFETGQIEDALYTLDRLAAVEESPEKRAMHYMRIAALYREKLQDDSKAREYLNLALDADPDRLEAFRALDEILTAAKRWEDQAEDYRRMLDRIKDRGVPDLEFRLYSALGEIYRSRLKQLDYAIPAYAMAARRKPDDVRTHAILAQLYEMTGDQFEKAVEEHRAIVYSSPLSPEVAPSLKAMRRIFRDRQEFDKAFMTASALVALRHADDEEAEFFERDLEPSLPWFKGTIDPLRWESHLMSKAENPILGTILQVLHQGLGADLGARDLKDIGLKKKNELDLDQKLLFANVYRAVSKALGALPHKVYRDDATIGTKVEFLVPPALVVGADMLTGREEREIAFLVGRQLSYLHPRHFLAAVKNLTELKVFLVAALKFARPETQVATGAEVVSELVRLIERRMPQAQKSQLTRLMADLEAREPDMDFGRMFDEYFAAIERTALRAGVLVCGNLDVAMTIVGAEEVSFSGLPKKERLEEVVRFGVSDDHFVLRRALGIAVETGPSTV